MHRKTKSQGGGVFLRTERGIYVRMPNDNFRLTKKKQAAGLHLFSLGRAVLGRAWQKILPSLKSVGF